MDTTSTSKRTLHNAGYYAFAGSLLLHAGFIALVASWQWELKAPEKKESKIIQVTFLPAPAKPEITKKPKPLKTTATAPAQPLALHSAAILKLRPRTPDSAMPTRPPANAAYRMPLAIHTRQKRPRIRQTSLFMKAEHPTAARPLKVERTRHTASQGIGTRPLPAFTAHWNPSSQIMAQANSQRPNNPASIHPRTTPPFAQPAPEKSIAIKSGGAQAVSLSTQVNSRIPVSGNGSRPNLGLLRGAFAGKVRQRIANVQSYPRIARRRGWEGRPVIAFTLDKRGRLTKVDLAQTSGYRLLDRAALKAVQKAAPYPEIPAQLKLDSFQFKLPISFVLK